MRKHQRDDEPLADVTNDKPLDVSSIIPIHAKSMEYAEKPETKSKPRDIYISVTVILYDI